MKNILFLTTTPTVGGNGDALIDVAMEEAKSHGADVHIVHVREKQIGFLLWVVVIGGIPTMLSMTLAHLLRSEGHAKHASAGMMFGGILNIILDPLLMFVAEMGFVGSAVATDLKMAEACWQHKFEQGEDRATEGERIPISL